MNRPFVRPQTPWELVVIALAAGIAGSGGRDSAAAGSVPDGGVAAAYDFLYRQMDRFHSVVPVAGDSAYQAYFPSGRFGSDGALDDLTVSTAGCEKPHSGGDCVRIDYRPEAPSASRWNGLYFQYPDGNWGERPGRNLADATRLSFWARAEPPMVVRFFSGGINRPAVAGKPYQDSFGPVETGRVRLTEDWQRFRIPLRNENLSSVIGALGMTVASSQGGRPGAIFLDDVEIDHSLRGEPRFLQSFLPGSCATEAPENVAHVYDQALTLLAFLARGQPEDRRRAELIARALVQAQNSDRTYRGTLGDGRLRNGYASGPLLDSQSATARLPGRWDGGQGAYLEDEYSAGSDTGNAAWAALALVQAHRLLPKRDGSAYLEAALKLGDWIVRETRASDTLGGFRGGYEGFERTDRNPHGQVRSEWRSTEHNIDLVALFGHLADAVGRDTVAGREWLAEQAHARRFVEAMVAETEGGMHLWTGTKSGTTMIDRRVVPLDAQTWAVLGLGQPGRYEPALDWALGRCGAGAISHGFDFNCNDGDGAWWEGTAQVVAALRALDRDAEAKPIVARLGKAQITTGAARGALPAASSCGLTTGLDRLWHSDGTVKPWLYPDAPHVGATAWYASALLGKNLFELTADMATPSP
jgi:hypothetical protein